MGMNRFQALIYILSYPDLTELGFADGIGNKYPEEWADEHWAAWGEKEMRQYPTDEYMCSLLRYRRWGNPDPTTARIVRTLKWWTDSKTVSELLALYDSTKEIDCALIAHERQQAADADWLSKVSGQPWYYPLLMLRKGWQRGPGGVYTNPRNEALTTYGTWDVVQYAIDQGFAPGPDSTVKPAPDSREPDPTPMPATKVEV